jgi:hypothetical protein
MSNYSMSTLKPNVKILQPVPHRYKFLLISLHTKYLLKMPALYKAFITLVTFVVTLICMCAFMSLAVSRRLEAHIAKLTLVRLLT